jgi:hypothetical protein
MPEQLTRDLVGCRKEILRPTWPCQKRKKKKERKKRVLNARHSADGDDGNDGAGSNGRVEMTTAR